MIRVALIAAALLPAAQAAALDLALPATARLTLQDISDPASYGLPAAVHDGAKVPMLALEGRVERRAWRIDGQSLTSLQILAPLREQIAEAGGELLLDCAAAQCGGFDFRFGIEVLPAPAMHVALTDYHQLSVRLGEGSHMSLLVSRSAAAGFVQIVQVTAAGGAADALEVALTAPVPASTTASAEAGDLDAELSRTGRVILTGLDFGTGSAELDSGPHASLVALAAALATRPGWRIALVGHTDSVGALEGNIALSRRRAAAVMERLASVHGIDRSRMEAGGMGYLAPVAPNTTPEGREANRRVEAVLLNTE